MMVFTFMPTMAFANVQKTGSNPVQGIWAADGTYVTVNGRDWPARRSLQTHTQGWTTVSDARILAQLDDSSYSQAALVDVPLVTDAYFYDLTGATLNLADIYTQTGFEALFDNPKTASGDLKSNYKRFNLKTPEYVYNYENQPKTTQNVQLSGWTVKVAFPENYVEDSETDQTVTLTAVIESNGADGTQANPYRVDNTTITKTVKVLGSLPKASGLHFYKDKVTVVADAIATPVQNQQGNWSFDISNDNTTFTYDGEAHSVVSNSVSGYTVTYATLNAATGKYEGDSAECPTVTNVGDVKKVKATISWTETTSDGTTTTTVKKSISDTFTMSVIGAHQAAGSMPAFQFDGNGDVVSKSLISNNVPSVNNVGTSYIYTVADGEQYDATKWIDPVGLVGASKEKAVVANETALMDFFNDFYTVKTSKKAAYPDYEFLSIEKKEDKEFDKATFTALKTKHATLLKNFLGFSDATLKDMTYTQFKSYVADPVEGAQKGAAYFYSEPEPEPEPTPVVEDKDDDINFTGVTKTIYSGKKVIKKGKLKKTKSFVVSAAADSGKEVKYVGSSTDKKITVSSTGKVTVKKGLKKGTYKVKVTAKTVAGDGYKAAKATETYTIVIKKK
jgi:hypothetical protein